MSNFDEYVQFILYQNIETRMIQKLNMLKYSSREQPSRHAIGYHSSKFIFEAGSYRNLVMNLTLESYFVNETKNKVARWNAIVLLYLFFFDSLKQTASNKRTDRRIKTAEPMKVKGIIFSIFESDNQKWIRSFHSSQMHHKKKINEQRYLIHETKCDE